MTAQVLAPASAGATVNQSGATGCMPVGLGSIGINLATGEPCSLTGGSAPAGWESIKVEGTAPPCVRRSACEPTQIDSAGSRAGSKDGDRLPPSSGGRGQLSPAAKKTPRQRACASANERLRQLNARDVLEYAKELAAWEVDNNSRFLRKPWLEERIPEVKRLQRVWSLKECSGLPGLGQSW